MADRLAAPASGVTVRMYRQGFGDCFLLAFATDQPDRPYYVLIDCGLLTGEQDIMRAVATDVQAATGGVLHVAVITHEHWDHVSGFQAAKDIFAGMTIHQLWLSWVLNVELDTLAQELREDVAGMRLGMAQHLAAARNKIPPPVQALAEFDGRLGAAGADRVGKAIEVIRAMAKHVEYFSPGRRLPAFPEVDGLQPAGVGVHVLGPPRDLKALRKMDPSGGEAFFTTLSPFGQAALAGEGMPQDALRAPFDAEQGVPLQRALREDAFFRRRFASDSAWRAIGPDFEQGSAEALALKLTSVLNNTSLVLAFELAVSRKVLLFAADAQVGSWLGWSSEPGVDVDDLMKRTALYKVGHHGSGNATVRAARDGTPKGFGLMGREDLVALMPVRRETASDRGWEIPDKELEPALAARTAGRVLDSDPDRPVSLEAAGWQKVPAPVVNALSVDITMLDA